MPKSFSHTLARRTLAAIREHSMLTPGETLGLATSGGADSIALLRLFLELRSKLRISLCVVHLNHKLRGKHSDADEKFVAKVARQFGLELFSATKDCAAEAKRHRWNLEDAGRRTRYTFFASLIEQGKCHKVATAHTADDQAETVLARLLRGTGIRGLAGIHPVQGHIIRPLLNVRRADLRQYLKTLRQPWREDKTNRDQSRLRARLRHSLIPMLECDYNPHIVELLNSLATQADSEESFWNVLIEAKLATALTKRNGVLTIALDDLLAAGSLFSNPSPAPSAAPSTPQYSALALSRRIILTLLYKLAPAARFDSKHIEQVLRLARTSQSGRQIELPYGLRVARNFDNLEFSAARLTTVSTATNSTASKMPPQPSNPAKLSVSISSHAHAPYTYEYAVALRDKTSVTIDVPELDTRFRLKLVDWPSTARETNQCDVLDADLLKHPLALRNWRPGDVYRLPGNDHAQKFKRYFTSRRISLRERPGWPVLSSGPEIAWTRGFVAANFRANKASKRGLLVLEG